jgi:spore cortex formation protein SpoVR/YcgB (stage V sporulation)
MSGDLLFRGADWDFDTLRRIHDACAQIASDELGLDTYPVRIEVISAEQMLDAYASTGVPILYKHWSFGKHFAVHEASYRKGMAGLAYELVINSNPCLCYVLEENSATMQALVVAHAAFGHNHFFKQNYLFRQWTQADGILEYLRFARGYIASCEERHGVAAVERLLDAAHALTSHGVHRYPRSKHPDLASEQQRERERREHEERTYDDLWGRTVPKGAASASAGDESRRRALLELPQENLLYFLEKSAPRLQPWQREVLRIVRLIAQYFYPQAQTKVMNEGCATYVHYKIMGRLHETGRIDDGAYLEFLRSHGNVILQPEMDDPRFGGINPYALGFGMMRDIERICTDPTAEDRDWFPDIAGSGDPYAVLRHTWADFRDESFVAQFMSPKFMRDWRLFHLIDDAEEPVIRVDAIHDEDGYRNIRRALARTYDVGARDPEIEIVDVDLAGDRQLKLRHRVHDGILLDEADAARTLQHLADLWGYEVVLIEADAGSGAELASHRARARGGLLASP